MKRLNPKSWIWFLGWVGMTLISVKELNYFINYLKNNGEKIWKATTLITPRILCIFINGTEGVGCCSVTEEVPLMIQGKWSLFRQLRSFLFLISFTSCFLLLTLLWTVSINYFNLATRPNCVPFFSSFLTFFPMFLF